MFLKKNDNSKISVNCYLSFLTSSVTTLRILSMRPCGPVVLVSLSRAIRAYGIRSFLNRKAVSKQIYWKEVCQFNYPADKLLMLSNEIDDTSVREMRIFSLFFKFV